MKRGIIFGTILWLLSAVCPAQVAFGAGAGNDVSEATSSMQADAVNEGNRHEPMPLAAQFAIVEVVGAGYAYLASDYPDAYVGLTGLFSAIFVSDYVSESKPDDLVTAALFGAMALRRRNIDTASTPRQEVAKSTFVDFNVMMALALLAEHFLLTQEKGKPGQKSSLNYVPQPHGGTVILSYRF